MRKKLIGLAAVAGLMLLIGPTPGRAADNDDCQRYVPADGEGGQGGYVNHCQVNDADDCRSFLPGPGNDGRGDFINTCAASDQSRINDIYIPMAIQQALARSFGIGPDTVEPAGLQAIVSGEAARRLSPSHMVIVPTAAAAQASPNFNAWADARFLYTDYTKTAGNLDGPTYSGLAGIDYKVNSKFTIGLLLSGDHSNLKGTLTNLNSHSLGGGSYIGLVLNPHIVFSANVLGSKVASDQASGLLKYDTTRLQASTAVNGYWYTGTWRFTPGLSFAWSKDWEREKNGLTADRTIETGLLSSTVQLGKTLRLSDKATVEPWAGAALDWTPLSSTHSLLAGTDNTASIDFRLQAGFNFNFGSNAQLAITGEVGGLHSIKDKTYSAEANLAIQF